MKQHDGLSSGLRHSEEADEDVLEDFQSLVLRRVLNIRRAFGLVPSRGVRLDSEPSGRNQYLRRGL